MIECNRTMEQARRDFAAGKVTSALLVRVPMMRSAWTLRLSGARGDAGMLLAVETLAPQVFTSLDKAVAAIEEVGFAVEQLKVLG